MGDCNELTDLLQKDWLCTILGPYLSFADLRNLSLSNKPTHAAVQKLAGTWPQEIRNLPKQPSSLLMFGIHGACSIDDVGLYRHPAPIIRFQVDSLSYDDKSKKLMGQPWSEMAVNNSQPPSLGRLHPSVCSANDSGSKIFYCGGRLYVDGGDDVRWSSVQDMTRSESKTTGIFDTETCIWARLPQMPEPRSGAGIFRIGSRIYVLVGREGSAGSRSTLCFDLDQERWIESGFDAFPGNAYAGTAVVVIDQSTVIVAGGETITEWHNEYGLLTGQSSAVFSLNTNSGVWTQLSDLPEIMCEGSITCFLVRSKDEPGGTEVVMLCNNKNWARLIPNGEWAVSSDLRGYELTTIRFSFRNSIFSGSKWIALPPHHFDFGVQVGDMALCWSEEAPPTPIKY